MGKYAIIVPGKGYHTDKPLLYYSSKLADSLGYSLIRVRYPDSFANLKNTDNDSINEFIEKGLTCLREAVKDTRFSDDDEVLFISKSIGTTLAAAYSSYLKIKSRHVLFTPLIQTFSFLERGSGIAFNGTKDSWADCDRVRELCKEKDIPIMTVQGANHSLETGMVMNDIDTLNRVMDRVDEYISRREASIYGMPVKGQDGKSSYLREYKDQVMLIVNTATGCGFTPQYRFLEEIYRKYKKEGFVVLDFPCNQFGKQAPGTNKEIQDFCTSRYDTSFPRFAKIDVNGPDEEKLFRYLKDEQGFRGFGDATKEARFLASKLQAEDPEYEENDEIKWNFTKFIVDREGRCIARFEPTDPLDDVEEMIKRTLNT